MVPRQRLAMRNHRSQSSNWAARLSSKPPTACTTSRRTSVEQCRVLDCRSCARIAGHRLRSPLLVAESLAPARHVGQVGILCEGAQAGFQPAGQDHIVGVEKADECAARLAQSAIAGRARPCVRGAQHATLVALEVGQHGMGGLVGGTIVDDDDLHVLHGLAARAVDRLAQKPAVVEARHDDGNPGHHRRCPNENRLSQDGLMAASKAGKSIHVDSHPAEKSAY